MSTGVGAPLAGGVKLDTPFGAIYPAHITTDPESGIGGRAIEDFAKAVMQGTRFLTKEDRRAIATYLMDDHTGG